MNRYTFRWILRALVGLHLNAVVVGLTLFNLANISLDLPVDLIFFLAVAEILLAYVACTALTMCCLYPCGHLPSNPSMYVEDLFFVPSVKPHPPANAAQPPLLNWPEQTCDSGCDCQNTGGVAETPPPMAIPVEGNISPDLVDDYMKLAIKLAKMRCNGNDNDPAGLALQDKMDELHDKMNESQRYSVEWKLGELWKYL